MGKHITHSCTCAYAPIRGYTYTPATWHAHAHTHTHNHIHASTVSLACTHTDHTHYAFKTLTRTAGASCLKQADTSGSRSLLFLLLLQLLYNSRFQLGLSRNDIAAGDGRSFAWELQHRCGGRGVYHCPENTRMHCTHKSPLYTSKNTSFIHQNNSMHTITQAPTGTYKTNAIKQLFRWMFFSHIYLA